MGNLVGPKQLRVGDRIVVHKFHTEPDYSKETLENMARLVGKVGEIISLRTATAELEIDQENGYGILVFLDRDDWVLVEEIEDGQEEEQEASAS